MTKNLDLYWNEPDEYGDCSHSEIISRLNIRENVDIFLRDFVSWQCPDWIISSFEFDEENTLPGWAEEHKQDIVNKVAILLNRVFPLWAEYQCIEQAAWEEYERIEQTAREEYERIQQPALEEYERVKRIAREEYKRIEQPAWEEYVRTEQPAWQAMITGMRSLPGYVEVKDGNM